MGKVPEKAWQALTLCPFLSTVDGGYGYLKDAMWWAGFLTSKWALS